MIKKLLDWLKALFVVLLILGSMTPLQSRALALDFEGHEYWIYTGESKTVEWDTVTGATKYLYKVVQLETNLVYKQGEVTSNQFVVRFDRFGHFRVEVASSDGVLASPYILSTDKAYAVVNGVGMGWVIYARVAPPSSPNVGPQ